MEIVLNDNNFDSEVLKSDKIVLVDFYADWCGPCQMMSPIIKEIAEERADVKVCRINVDENPGMAIKFKVVSIPFFVVFKNGEVYKKSLGYQSKEDIIELLS